MRSGYGDNWGAPSANNGRDGQGPGEIRGANELEVTPDGQIWIVDYGNSRITRRDSNGELLGSNLLVVVPTPEASTCQFCPISVGPSGRVYGPKGDTAAVVSEVGKDGEQISTLQLEGVPAVKRSAAEMDRIRASSGRLPIPEGVAVPEPTFSPFKSRFGRHAIGFDAHGSIWLAPKVADGAPSVFYLFDSGGRFISTVGVDDYLTGFKIRGSNLLGIGETEIGEPVLRVYEIR